MEMFLPEDIKKAHYMDLRLLWTLNCDLYICPKSRFKQGLDVDRRMYDFMLKAAQRVIGYGRGVG